MARLKVKFPKGISARIAKTINNAIDDQDLQSIASDLVKDIQSGKNPKTGRAYKGLKSSTIKRRKVLSKVNRTSSKYSPSKSNLTFTGNFLKSIKAKLTKQGNSKTIIIEPTGIHPGYNLVRGGKSSPVSNKTIAEGQEAMGRNVITFSKKRVQQIRKKIQQLLRRAFA